jgi:hypothetical protein
MVNNDSHQMMIDDCGDVDEYNEKSVGFVQEWINTYVFLSREFLPFFSLLVFLFSFLFFIFPHANFLCLFSSRKLFTNSRSICEGKDLPKVLLVKAVVFDEILINSA